jgi:hypothetical protein
MDKLEGLGVWLITNKAKKGTPEFEEKANEYKLLRYQQKYEEASQLPDSDRKLAMLDHIRTEIANAGGTPKLSETPMVTQTAGEGELIEVPAPPPPEAPAADTSGADAASRFLMGGTGAAVGTAASTAGIASNALANRSARVAGMQEEARLAAQARAAAQAASSAAPDVIMAAPSGSMVSRPAPAAPGGAPGGAPALAGPRSPAMTPAGGTGTANYGQRFGLGEIERNRALDMTKNEGGVHDLTTKRREALKTLETFAPEYRELPNGFMVNTRNARERFVQNPQSALPAPTPAALPGPAPMADVVQPTLQPAAPARAYTPPRMSALDQVSELYRRMMNTPLADISGRVLRRVAPPMAAAGAGLDLAEIEHELRKEADQRDYGKIALRGAGALGGALSLIPTPATIAIGSGLGLGAAGLEYLKDKGYFD